MNGEQVEECISKIIGLSTEFRGVYLNNHIPDKFIYGKNIFFIVNTIIDPIKERIGHYVLFYIQGGDLSNHVELIFGDSYGFHPNFYGGKIKEFFNSYPFSSKCLFDHEIQQDTSMVCGIYTIFFSHKLFKNIPLKTIKKYFGCNKKRNDSLMLCYFRKIMGIDFETYIR